MNWICHSCCIVSVGAALTSFVQAQEFRWKIRSQQPTVQKAVTDQHAAIHSNQHFTRTTQEAVWPANKTAFLVCDVWDQHHCLNAVRRLEQFAPRLDDVLREARNRGALIIHAPSDCMAAYEQHPARLRVKQIPLIDGQPPGTADWCSRIPGEELAVYPIDQSDGGEDDDPAEHAAWAAKLRAMGRNPNMPWKTQSPMITINGQQDFISDRGDEIWNILKHHGIEHVVLTGVHTNMCVLGRPFGLRQMVRNGFHVVLMRDMTDCMYNPQRWPYVDHFTGNDLVISHIERFVCPTVTSDQLLGGSAFRFAEDNRQQPDVMSVTTEAVSASLLTKQWCVASVPSDWSHFTAGQLQTAPPTVWYRCAVVLPESLRANRSVSLSVAPPAQQTAGIELWVNGQPSQPTGTTNTSDDGLRSMVFNLPAEAFDSGDAVLLVIRAHTTEPEERLLHSDQPPQLILDSGRFDLRGRWQVRTGDDSSWCNLPLPAKFGAAPDIVIEPGKASGD